MSDALEYLKKLNGFIEGLKWKGERCANPEKGWITNADMTQRITRLGSRKMYGNFIEEHNNRLDLILNKLETLRAALEAQEVDVDNILERIYSDMDQAFKLGKHHDDGLCNDDTQIGIEWALKWLASKGYLRTPCKEIAENFTHGKNVSKNTDNLYTLPDGWIAMPKENTKEMAKAIGKHLMVIKKDMYLSDGWYNSLIAAAPKLKGMSDE